MGEHKTKPAAWSGSVSTLDRWVLLRLLEFDGVPCQTCGAARMSFDGAQKVAKVNRVWDAFQLDAVEKLTQDEMRALFGMRVPSSAEEGAPAVQLDAALAAPLPVVLDNDLVRFVLAEIIPGRVRFSLIGGCALALPLAHQLLDHARTARISLRERKDDELGEVDDARFLTLTEKEREAVWEALVSPDQCKASFPLTDGNTLPCRRPMDGPRTLREVEEWCRLLVQLRMAGELFAGTDPTFREGTAPDEYLVDMATSKLLLPLLVARAPRLARGVRRLGGVIAQLEDHKAGKGRPPAEAPEPTSPAG